MEGEDFDRESESTGFTETESCSPAKSQKEDSGNENAQGQGREASLEFQEIPVAIVGMCICSLLAIVYEHLFT